MRFALLDRSKLSRVHFAALLAGVALAACSSADHAAAGSAGDADGAAPSAPVASADAAPSEDAGPPPPAAVTALYADLHASAYDKSEADALALDEVVAGAPSPGDTAIVRGLAHLWHLAEFGRDANPAVDSASLTTEGIGLLSQFQMAQAANPDDARVACWLGTTQVTTGRKTNNDALVQQGYATIEAGISKYPQFNDFCKALAYADLPASDPDYAKAPAAMFTTMDACVGESVDRANPDVTKYLAQETDQGPSRVCWDNAIAPHGGSGFYLYMGDLLVKAGQVPVAKIAYNNAKLVKGYASWPYKSLLEDRLSADLDAKAAAYGGADSTKWPALGGDSQNVGCSYCHASSN